MLYRTITVWKKIKSNPLNLKKTGTLKDFVVVALFVMLGLSLLNVIAFSFIPEFYPYLVPIWYLENQSLQMGGIFVLVLSMLWVALGQAQMGISWRIGIDKTQTTKLVKTGFYRFSRNPIYFGILVSGLGLFLVLPNATSLVLVVGSVLLMNIQVRLEEEYLKSAHSKDYEDFCKKVPRWI